MKVTYGHVPNTGAFITKTVDGKIIIEGGLVFCAKTAIHVDGDINAELLHVTRCSFIMKTPSLWNVFAWLHIILYIKNFTEQKE